MLTSQSGKSSCVLAFLQMLDLSEGRILVDGIDLSTISHETTRTKITSITQEPFFLPGSIKFNLDFYEASTISQLEEVLKKVELWDSVLEKGGLEAPMHMQSWSLGQQQLFCMARAMLKKSCILILDEATSRYDHPLPNLIQPHLDLLQKTYIS
jgi:ATP-binding cassette subfamily C (CFTR/MRP) protein 1